MATPRTFAKDLSFAFSKSMSTTCPLVRYAIFKTCHWVLRSRAPAFLQELRLCGFHRDSYTIASCRVDVWVLLVFRALGEGVGEEVGACDAEVGQREEDEVAQVGARVGEGERGVVGGDAFVEDDVEVDGAGAVAEGSDAAGVGLDGVEFGEEVARGEVGLDEERGVEEAEVGKLWGDILRRGVVAAGGLEDGGAGERGDGGDRGIKGGLAVAEVGT